MTLDEVQDRSNEGDTHKGHGDDAAKRVFQHFAPDLVQYAGCNGVASDPRFQVWAAQGNYGYPPHPPSYGHGGGWARSQGSYPLQYDCGPSFQGSYVSGSPSSPPVPNRMPPRSMP